MKEIKSQRKMMQVGRYCAIVYRPASPGALPEPVLVVCSDNSIGVGSMCIPSVPTVLGHMRFVLISKLFNRTQRRKLATTTVCGHTRHFCM